MLWFPAIDFRLRRVLLFCNLDNDSSVNELSFKEYQQFMIKNYLLTVFCVAMVMWINIMG